jgi:Gpi18-like mannosyltransferase
MKKKTNIKKSKPNLDLSAKRFDESFITFIQKNLNLIFFITATLLAFFSRNSFRGYLSGDMALFYEPWTAHLQANGGFLGIPSLHSDYTVIYQYILAFISYLPGSTIAKIKLVTWVFDFFAAFVVAITVAKLTNRKFLSRLPILAYTITLFVPAVFMNSALWGQCDIIYTSFVLLSFYFVLDDRYGLAFVYYGLALSFKLQAIFFLPLLVILYLKTRKFSLLNFLYTPVVYFITYIPALFLGKHITQIFEAYGMQIASHQNMVLGFPNLYALLPDNYDLFSTAGYLLTAITLGGLAFLVVKQKQLTMSPDKKVELALIISIMTVFFLPKMHERYMFMADLFAILYLFVKPKPFYIPIILWGINAMVYPPYFFGTPPWFDHKIVAFILLGVLLSLIYDFFKTPSKHDQFNHIEMMPPPQEQIA